MEVAAILISFVAVYYAWRATEISRNANELAIGLNQKNHYPPLVAAVEKNIRDCVGQICGSQSYYRENDGISNRWSDLNESQLPKDFVEARIEWRRLANNCESVDSSVKFEAVKAQSQELVGILNHHLHSGEPVTHLNDKTWELSNVVN